MPQNQYDRPHDGVICNYWYRSPILLNPYLLSPCHTHISYCGHVSWTQYKYVEIAKVLHSMVSSFSTLLPRQ